MKARNARHGTICPSPGSVHRILPLSALLALSVGCAPADPSASDSAEASAPPASAPAANNPQAGAPATAPAGADNGTAEPMPDPLVFDTFVPGPCSPNGQAQGQCPPGDLFRVRLATVAEGLRSPRHMAFTPDGDLLITELAPDPEGVEGAVSASTTARPGQLRVVRNGVLEPEPVAGWPSADIYAGPLWSVAVHPDFAANRTIYLFYIRRGEGDAVSRAVARARFDGTALTDVEEIFIAEPWIPGGPMAGRLAFGPDGLLYLTVNDHVEHDHRTAGEPLLAQMLDNDIGKVLRIRDDGSIPDDNPFVGDDGARPEIFTYGQRNVTDFAWHPETGELWTTEIAPLGGDEINILHAGHNYGWPLVTLGKNYDQSELNDNRWYRPGMDMPALFWVPSISPQTLVWYTGDKLEPWQGHLFVGALNGQTLVRVAFDQPLPQMERRDSLFIPLGLRWRHVIQSPDGYLYALTEKRTLGSPSDPNDATSGKVWRIEPAD